MNMNNVTIAGNLTRDPETKSITDGTTIARLGVALNRRWKDRVSGEVREKTTFVDVEAWGQAADFCAQYLRKGSVVLVEGELELQSWEDRQTGQKRSKLLVKARRVQSARSEGQRTQTAAAPQPAASAPVAEALPPPAAPGPGPAPGDDGDTDDSIPF